MKAAVLHHFGSIPRYEDFPDPTPEKDEILVQVKAVALEHIDKAMAKGTHYASRQFLPKLPAIVGSDGIAMRDDGQLVGFGGLRPPYGAMAEKAVFPKAYHVPIPNGVDAATAATVPASVLTSLFPLKWGAKLQPDETVLINGATGFAGKLAIQVILDFVWGHPTELLLEALVPRELSIAQHRVRLVQIGEMAGPTISLAAEALRTSGLEILGAGSSLAPEAIAEGTQQVWEWIKAGKLQADIEQVPLRDVESAWKRTDVHGKRIVIVS